VGDRGLLIFLTSDELININNNKKYQFIQIINTEDPY